MILLDLEVLSVTDEDTLLIEQLSSEYKILQDKIDKIGGFKFTIRGWSLTLAIASTITIGSSQTLSPWLLLWLIVFVIVFYMLEHQQDDFQFLFGRRVQGIEKEIRRIVRSYPGPHGSRTDIGLTPRIAHLLSEDARRRQPRGRFAKQQKWIRRPERWFYIVQIIAILLAIVILLYLRPARVGTQKPMLITATYSLPADIKG
jgi:hypothetical protein